MGTSRCPGDGAGCGRWTHIGQTLCGVDGELTWADTQGVAPCDTWGSTGRGALSSGMDL
jgi:hypothetical protein